MAVVKPLLLALFHFYVIKLPVLYFCYVYLLFRY
jgi:hypothetical protein